MRIPPIRKIRSLGQARRFLMTEGHHIYSFPTIDGVVIVMKDETLYRLAVESLQIIGAHVMMTYAQRIQSVRKKHEKQQEEIEKRFCRRQEVICEKVQSLSETNEDGVHTGANLGQSGLPRMCSPMPESTNTTTDGSTTNGISGAESGPRKTTTKATIV